MSGGNALAVVLSLSAGLAGAVQAAALGRLGDRIGTVQAVAFSTLVAGTIGVAVLLIARQSLAGIGQGARQPLWLWLGGAFSAFIVLSITMATPRIGVTATVSVLIAGNLVMAAFIDRFGWFGVDKLGLTWERLVGIALLAGGAALILREMSAAAAFVHAINAHDAEALVALMTEDHLFVDAEGNEFRGRDAMAGAWRGYFEWFPDYEIEVERTISGEGVVGFFGWAAATYAENGRSFRLPAAWLAVEEGGLVAEWRVYCDTRLPYEIVGQ